jgi:hypothetical protein
MPGGGGHADEDSDLKGATQDLTQHKLMERLSSLCVIFDGQVCCVCYGKECAQPASPMAALFTPPATFASVPCGRRALGGAHDVNGMVSTSPPPIFFL